MLSEAERRQLAAIESQLCTDDPVFVQRFAHGWLRRRPGGWRRFIALLAVVLAAAAAVSAHLISQL